jgi:hypothetical protein
MTSYSDYLGSFVTEPKNYIDEELKSDIKNGPSSNSSRERLGYPEGVIPYEDNYVDIQLLVADYVKYGLTDRTRKDINPELRQHVVMFKETLFVYDQLIKKKVFCIEELYLRCLTEGPSFTKYIKKSRAYSLQYKIAIGESSVPDEYIHEEYTGYDSILHERYLIYWDDLDDTVDWPYSLLEERSTDCTRVLRGWRGLANVYDVKVPDSVLVSLIDKITSKKSSKIDEQKTTNLKNTWDVDRDTSRGYFSTRKVVPVESGSTRDTGVPDVVTLNKLKRLHSYIKEVCAQVPYSANVDFETLNYRIQRLRSKEVFIHIDFKKFGLLFPRKSTNILLEELGLEEFKLEDYVLRTEDGDIKTNRGGTLGWFDSLVSLVTISIIYDLACEEGWTTFDMLQFNDDIEIGFSGIGPEELKYRQNRITQVLDENDFYLSWKKIFSSTTSIFLEDYEPRDTDLDLTKVQLAVKPFAKCLTTKFLWEAKLLFAQGANYGYTTELKERAMNNFDPILPDEYERPVELCGWTYKGVHDLNTALEEASIEELYFFLSMKKYKEPHLMSKVERISIHTIDKKRENAIRNAHGPVDFYKHRIELDDPIQMNAFELHANSIEREDQECEPEPPPRLPRRPPRPDVFIPD